MKLKKVILALLAFAFAGACALVLKEFIDSRHPEYAVPRPELTADGQSLNATVSECSWRFYTGSEYSYSSGYVYDLDLAQNDLLGGETLSVGFSQKPLSMKVFRSAPYSYDFALEEGVLTVPYESGGYLYEVNAQFSRGYVQLYFYIVVQ